MRAVRFHEYGGPAVLGVDDVPVPEPPRNTVRISAEVASVNPLDAVIRAGVKPPAELPWQTGNDVAGVVDAVGPGVSMFAAGDRVVAAELGSDWPGTFAEAVIAPVDRVAAVPDGVSLEAAAAAAHAGVTAWRGLVDLGDVAPGDTVLVQGGSGGVGHLAVQLGAAAGATVIATAGSGAARDRVADLGADTVLDYARDDLEDAVRGAAPDGLDAVLETHVGAYLDMDVRLAAPGASIVVIGGDDASLGTAGIARGKDLTIRPMGSSKTPDIAGVLGRLCRLMAAGALEVNVADRFPLEEAAAAQRAVAEDRFFGKLVVEI